LASSTSTVTGGAMVSPAAALLGFWMNASLLAAAVKLTVTVFPTLPSFEGGEPDEYVS
jgi:hypothetical protein